MYRYRRKLSLGLEEAEEKFKAKLKERGYKVVLEFTPSEVVKANLGVDMEPYRILWVCNPKIFYEMTKEDYEIGSFAPCPVLFYQKNGETYVAINTADDAVGIMKEPLELVKEVIEGL
ncbi:hypothetical protein CL1_1844 [Thermococcus cleftensis]|uniref:DUF302 domain-containing protein n=1 Tax=Thermococcus cleftensis (strain DSM 27260 / KACC 17922 / CL1) TaxID=163003 RepID=I3ZWF6_THECF|nr:DUF302 domain-containing protein [Thermococcus cleftensis]AFL96040.1 hypothetical protein CL1_1844 [Thermococcus cleftensis]